ERGTRQIHLAADLDPAGRAAFQRKRNRADRADVGGDISAARPVASRRATQQRSVVIRERDAQAIDLELGNVGRAGRVRKDPRTIRRRRQGGSLWTRRILETAPHALAKRAQFLLVVRVVEAEHRDDMLDGSEAFGRPPGHALRRRVRCSSQRRSASGSGKARAPYEDTGQSGGPSSGVPSSCPPTSANARYAVCPNSTNRTRRIECSDAARARTAPIMIRAHSSS